MKSKLEINNSKISGKLPNVWTLNNTYLKGKIIRETRRYFELNGNNDEIKNKTIESEEKDDMGKCMA